jgi:hypothetical protein
MAMHGRVRRMHAVSSQRRRRREWFALDRETHRPGRTVVVGLGDTVSGERSPGLGVASVLRDLLDAHPVAGVEVRQTAEPGADIIELLAGFERALLVHCVHADAFGPGQVRRVEAWPCARVIDSGSALQAEELRQALELAVGMGLRVPEPVELVEVCVPDGEPSAAIEHEAAREIHSWLTRPSPGGPVRGD